MVEIRNKLAKVGNSYFLRIPKALFDCKVLDKNKEVIAYIENLKSSDHTDTTKGVYYSLHSILRHSNHNFLGVEA